MTKAKRTPAARTSWFDSLSTSRKDLVTVAVLLVLVLFLFRDIVFRNMVFSTEGDTAASRSWAHAGKVLEEQEGAPPLWIPYAFSGMPGHASLAYNPRSVSYVQELVHAIGRVLLLNSTQGWLVLHYIIGGICMLLLAQRLGFSHIAALFAAITFMLSPYAIGLSQSGHGSKLMAVSYLPLVFLVTHEMFRRPSLLTLGLMSATMGTFMLTLHIQIVYYGLLLIGGYLVYMIIKDVKMEPGVVLARTAFFAISIAVGFAIASYIYLSVHEYAAYSIRGGGITGEQGGLSYSYATSYSFHPWEMLTFLIPSFFGLASPHYWGWKPFSDSSVYVGILPIVLTVIALALHRTRESVFFGIVTLIVLFMSFGNHFALFYDLLFNYLPYFNKFRAPEMVLHVFAFTTALLGAYGFQWLLDLKETDRAAKLRRPLLVGLGVAGSILLVGLLFRGGLYDSLSGFMFVKPGERELYQQHYGQQAGQIINQLKLQRFDLLWKDYVKCFMLFGVGAGAILLYLGRKLNRTTFAAAILATLAIDLILMDTKLVDPKPASAAEQRFQPDATIAFLQQQERPFRILPFGQLFGDNTFMYHTIESVGGYSPAKLKIYQTLIDSCLYHSTDPSFPWNMNVVNMLNARYILAQGQLSSRFELVNVDQAKRILTYRNPAALPRAYIVGRVEVVHTEREVFARLNDPAFDVATTAVVEAPLPAAVSVPETSSVSMVRYSSGELALDVYSSSPALLVLSEVYYPAGWKAYVDGSETEILKTNYVLRSVHIPAGRHSVTFRFEPAMYGLGWTLAHAGWAASLLLVGIGAWRARSERRKGG